MDTDRHGDRQPSHRDSSRRSRHDDSGRSKEKSRKRSRSREREHRSSRRDSRDHADDQQAAKESRHDYDRHVSSRDRHDSRQRDDSRKRDASHRDSSHRDRSYAERPDRDASHSCRRSEQSEERYSRPEPRRATSSVDPDEYDPMNPDGLDAAEQQEVELDAGVTPEEIAMMAAMGIPFGFDTTSGKEVDDVRANAGAVKAKQTRQARQYMNRRGGFNRPLPAEKTGEKVNLQ